VLRIDRFKSVADSLKSDAAKTTSTASKQRRLRFKLSLAL
jgi:hypothetical protein